MRIACIGGGPAGLYFAISVKLRDPSHEVVIHERNRADDTFGWGVVLCDHIARDPARQRRGLGRAIHANFAYWDDIDVIRHGRSHPLRRARLLRHRAQAAAQHPAGARRRASASSSASTSDVDDVVGLRRTTTSSSPPTAPTRAFASSAPSTSCPTSTCGRTASSGSASDRKLDAFTFVFENTEHGQIWLHAYQFEPETSTVIVECGPETWDGLGFAEMDADEAIARCEELFADFLGGARLRSNASHLRGSAIWMRFPRIHCERWYDGNVVLMGDAAHTAHFSIGSGTRLAMEDAIDLADRLCETDAARGARRLRGGAQARGACGCRRGAQLDGVVRERLALRASRRRAVRLRAAHAQPARQPREPAPARPRLSRRARDAGSRAGRPAGPRPTGRAADVHAVPAARARAAEPRRRLADGDVQRGRRHARRLPPRALRLARPGRRGARGHGDDRRRAGTGASRPAAPGSGTTSRPRPGSASSTSSTTARRRRSRCSSATRAEGRRRSSSGRARTSRSRRAAGRSWPPRRSRGRRPTRCRAR